MARTVKDTALATRAARLRLPPRGRPYWRALDEGLHLGYRKNRDGGKWVVRRYVGNQRYVIETLEGVPDDKADADGHTVLSFSQAQAVARRLHSTRGGAEKGIAAGPYLVKDAITDYLAWAQTHTKSARDTRVRAEALILPDLGGKEIAKLTAADIRGWHEGLARQAPRLRTRKGEQQRFREVDGPEAERRRKSTANRTLTILKAAFNYAWRDGKVSSDDAWRRVRPFAGVDAARVRYLAIDEAARLINASDPDLRPVVQAALLTGCRYGELAVLDVADFNPDAGTIHVRAGKSGKARHVVLNDEGVALFTGLTAGRAGAERMFMRTIRTDNKGNTARVTWGRTHQQRPFREACRRAKISPPVSFHELRHTYASLSIMAGAPPIVVAKNLGHADTRMVEKHYGHLADSYVADTIREKAPRFGVGGDGTLTPLRGTRGRHAA